MARALPLSCVSGIKIPEYSSSSSSSRPGNICIYTRGQVHTSYIYMRPSTKPHTESISLEKCLAAEILIYPLRLRRISVGSFLAVCNCAREHLCFYNALQLLLYIYSSLFVSSSAHDYISIYMCIISGEFIHHLCDMGLLCSCFIYTYARKSEKMCPAVASGSMINCRRESPTDKL